MRFPLCALAAAVLATAATPDGFVLVKETTVGGHRIDAFEICDHPVTSAEYRRYVNATGAKPPLQWSADNQPVIFVNRADADAYLKWRSRTEKRVYRLPTQLEFQIAAQAGDKDARYAWGNAAPEASKANYDSTGDRTFGEWRKYLKPVKSYPPNAWGLYDMAGNVWQMVDSYPDPATMQYKYRMDELSEIENGVAGGSWARSDAYLRATGRGGTSAGIRHPDLGFRVVRQPTGMTHFERRPRRLVAAPAATGGIYLGWQLLPGDARDTAFHVYRAARRDVAGTRISKAPVTGGTEFIDAEPPATGRTYYRVRAVLAEGREGPPSEWVAINLPAAKPSGLIATFQPTAQDGGGMIPLFGDLDGDGRMDCVLRLDHGIKEMSRDPGVPVELEAFTSWGRPLWRRPLVWHDHAYGSANNVPVMVWDLDGDGRAEVITRLQEGDNVYLAILDGMTGRVKRKTPWAEMATDFAKSSTRIHVAVAYLNGKTPSVVTQTGLYENEIFEAFDPELKKLWRFESFGETSGSGSHHIDVADVDGDGRDDIVDGTTVIGSDGKLKWSIYREHPDIVAVKHILPNSKGRQVFYAVETSTHAGAYLVDGATGKVLWKHNRETDLRWSHAHTGWVADIDANSPGLEMYTNRDGHPVKDTVLIAADGKILMEQFPSGWKPLNWTGAPVRDLISSDGTRLGHFNGKSIEPLPGKPNELGRGNYVMSADLAGDFRDEVVVMGKTPEGASAVFVYTNTAPVNRRELTRTADREYNLWLAKNIGGGYASYFEPEP